ncbi:hypothetical protein G9A89_008027 [Geosiphon pyriformis]|nr:hypothetical protein G9A89_008027 [Geosiphon pyriformis]
MSEVLGELRFLRFLPSFWWYDIAFVDQLRDHHGAVFSWYTFKRWKRLDPCGPVPEWFKLSSLVLGDDGPLNILKSGDFVSVCDHLLATSASSLSVYMDGSLSNLGTVGCRAGAAVFFEDIGLGLGISVSGLMLSTLAELQAVALAIECVPSSSSVCLFSDSQSALDACRSELGLVYPNYHNQCWVEHHHIVNVIHNKKLRVSFHKVKGHSGVSGNEHADVIAGAASLSNWYLLPCLSKHFLSADGGIVSGNLRHFHVVLVLGEVKVSDHVFSYKVDKSVRHQLLESHVGFWKAISSSSHSSSGILQLLSSGVSDFSVSMAFFKDFVFNGWFCKAVSVFHNPKIAVLEIVEFVCSLGLAFREEVWSVCAKHHAYMEKNRLIPLDGSAGISVHGLALRFSAGVVRLLGIANVLGVHFGFCKSCLFFLDIGDLVLVHITA